MCNSKSEVVTCGGIKTNYSVKNCAEELLTSLPTIDNLSNTRTIATRIQNVCVTAVDNNSANNLRLNPSSASPILDAYQ